MSEEKPINYCKYEPMGTRMLVLLEAAQQQTVSGLLLAGAAPERPRHGRVVRIAAEVDRWEVDDIVWLGAHGGQVLEGHILNGSQQELVLYDQTEILVRYHPDADPPEAH